MSDYISRQMLGTNSAEVGTNSATKRTVKGFPIDADLLMLKVEEKYGFMARDRLYEIIRYMPKYELPSAQPEQRYTEEELRVFQHGISLSLLSKRSSQHWQYDEDTATEIKFLERLYEKVGADIRSEHDG